MQAEELQSTLVFPTHAHPSLAPIPATTAAVREAGFQPSAPSRPAEVHWMVMACLIFSKTTQLPSKPKGPPWRQLRDSSDGRQNSTMTPKDRTPGVHSWCNLHSWMQAEPEKMMGYHSCD